MAGRKKSATGQDESSTAPTTRVLIVDDHELLRQGMRLMIGSEPDLEICGEAEDEAQAMQEVRELRPNLVIVDIGLKSGNGLDLIKRIKADAPSTRIIVSSMHEERLYGERVLRAGGQGYVNKQDPARTIITAIRSVLEGKMYFSEEFTNRVLERARIGNEAFQRAPIDALSDRELEVFRFIGQGLTTGEIAKKLHLSPSTVDTYRERLKTKLDLGSGTELVHEATQWVLENS